MQDYYKISEISKLYGIGVDSLRYYERIGLLNPKRGKNNYRLYSLNDLYKLNIIRDLRPLNFSMAQIKKYTEQLSLENTFDVLSEERMNIKKQITELIDIDKSLEERMNIINTSLSYEIDVFKVLSFPKRPCVQLNTNIRRDEEADFAIQRLHSKYEDKIFNLGKNPIGSTIYIEDLRNDNYGLFRSVFYILDNDDEYDLSLEEGDYLSYFYKGGYRQSPDQFRKILNYAKENNIKLNSSLYEIYHIDNRYTVKEDEFITEIQVKILSY